MSLMKKSYSKENTNNSEKPKSLKEVCETAGVDIDNLETMLETFDKELEENPDLVGSNPLLKDMFFKIYFQGEKEFQIMIKEDLLDEINNLEFIVNLLQQSAAMLPEWQEHISEDKIPRIQEGMKFASALIDKAKAKYEIAKRVFKNRFPDDIELIDKNKIAN